MLGLQGTRTAGTPSTKSYSCVACSATFQGLASLLVHQASHAGEISRQPGPSSPTCTQCGLSFASKEVLEKHPCRTLPTPLHSTLPATATVTPPLPAPDVYICECGEEYHDFSVLQEHKKSHQTEAISEPPLDSSSVKHITKKLSTQIDNETSNKSTSNQCVVSQPSSCHNLLPHTKELKPYHKTSLLPEPDTKDQPLSVSSTASLDQGHEISEPANLPLAESVTEEQDLASQKDSLSCQAITSSSSDSENSASQCKESKVPQKKALLKMLASAYMNSQQLAQENVEQSKRILPPRKVSPRAPIPITTPGSTAVSSSEMLKHQSSKKSDSNVGSPPGNMSTKKGNTVSVTQTFCPVVVLETRQKLIGYGKYDTEGRHQCGLCRRLFMDIDSLIMHHALHRKERVKCCRSCHQLIISITSVPDNHRCSTEGTLQYFPSIGKRLTAFSKSLPLTSRKTSFSKQMFKTPQTTQARKLFNCQLCHRSYTRLHNLKKHNCWWRSSLLHSVNLAHKNTAEQTKLDLSIKEESQNSPVKQSILHINVGVGTESHRPVKTEITSAESKLFGKIQTEFSADHLALKSLIRTGSPKSFAPFRPKLVKSTSVQQTPVVSVENRDAADSIQPVQVRKCVQKNDSEPRGDALEERGQWTVPLDDSEIDVLIEADGEADHENQDMLRHCNELEEKNLNKGMVHVNDDGKRRFVCKGCHKSYSRRFNLRKHLRICGAGRVRQHHSSEMSSSGAALQMKQFTCFQCGKSFNHRDTFMNHRMMCQVGNNPSVLLDDGGLLAAQTKASKDSIFVLPPPPPEKAPREHGSSNVNEGNWGIMSLPSVLPRKVTCECGATFSCPRLLFEHLQMHTQESYICPHCGDNLQSWAEYETHQQSHMQPQVQANELLAPQHHPSLLFHLQQSSYLQSSEQQRLVPSPKLAAKQQRPQQEAFPRCHQQTNRRPSPEQCVCHRCKKTFRLRSSLLRHLRLSCRGEMAAQKKICCSRCSMVFPNYVTLKVHMLSSTCTPSFKPMRCPVCVRWFSSVDGLKRHLVKHSETKDVLVEPSQNSQSNVFMCHICQRSYPKKQSLKDHLRKVHFKVKHVTPKPTVMRVDQPNQSSQFQCQICIRTYPTLQSLKRHKRRVHRIFANGLKPSNGITQQSESNQFHCQICQRSYPDIRSLKNHRRRVHRILSGGQLEPAKVDA
ncbi:zinc finger protein Xfin [Chanos chanos]|uniref:Zinc finger protein Xfin n=1 Tax=Chanos chanos TaxID=29144 RepID=A0A6J2WCX5_CHACN|nr:zinc finger protein Xfin-like [Chanos chanos]